MRTLISLREVLIRLHVRLITLEAVVYQGNQAHRLPVPNGWTVEAAWRAVKVGELPKLTEGQYTMFIILTKGDQILRTYR